MQTLRRTLFPILCLAFFLTAFVQADESPLQSRQRLLQSSLKDVRPAVVSVTDGIGFGTGVVVSGDGIVLTASHVVESSGSRQRRRRKIYVVFPDGERLRCELLGRNRDSDAAMLKIRDLPPQGSEYPHVEMGHSSELRRGDWCFALGHPGGRREDRPTVVRFGRVLSVGAQTIVSDNAIVLGDSGGPLFDLEGRLIGIHSMITRIIVENRHAAIDVWHRGWQRMREGRSWGELRISDTNLASTGFLGVGLRWNDYEARVSRVIKNSPADRGGLQRGDELLTINGMRFADRLGLNSLLAQLDERKAIPVTVRRDGRKKTLNVTTGRLPEEDDPIDDDEELEREYQHQITFERRIGAWEKRAAPVLREYDSATKSTKESVIQIRDGGRPVCLGAVMSEDGYVLTKSSEVAQADDPVCVLPDGTRVPFRRVASDVAWDLLLIRVDPRGRELIPVKWSRHEAPPGQLLITPNSKGQPMLPGVVSVASRELATATQGFLGVMLKGVRNGVRIGTLLPGGAAARDGMKEGDRVMSINDVDVKGSDDMIQRVRNYAPYSQLRIRVLRGEVVRTLRITLTPRFVSNPEDAPLPYNQTPLDDDDKRYVSIHSSGFREVLQHDTDLYPHQCGGPLLGINGEAVGLNIARAARIASYAIPADAVEKVYQDLRNQDAGSR